MTHSLVQNLGDRPHHIAPTKQTARVVLAAKNFGSAIGISHIGLGVTNLNNAKVLRRAGIYAEVWGAQTAAELKTKLAAAENHSVATGLLPVSHVIVNAPSWILPAEFADLAASFPRVEFVLMNHTGCAYLSMDKTGDTSGIKANRQCIDLEQSTHNFRIGGNNARFVQWFTRSFGAPCLYLPNMYDPKSFVDPYPAHREIGGTLRLGSFGAARPWKNQLVAAEAAVQLAQQLGVNLELYVNSRRMDDKNLVASRQDLFDGMAGCKLIEVPWQTWPQFRKTCGNMHLLLQPSFDETFNVVTADGIAMGVASVTSPSIEWTPKRWQAEPCDPSDLVKVALYLLNDKFAVEEARGMLRKYVADGLDLWMSYLTGSGC